MNNPAIINFFGNDFFTPKSTGSIQKVAILAFEENSEENCTFLEFRPL